MASRRISASAVNWAAIAERVPPNQRMQFNAFKSRSDKYMRAVMANPEQSPKIDWAAYKKNVAVAGLVDSFQKQYEALKVAYPADTVSATVDAQGKQLEQDIAKYIKESEARIAGYQQELAHLNSLLPFSQMTMEDFKDSYPELALDPINKPTFWPHTPEEQPGYVNPDAPPRDSHH